MDTLETFVKMCHFSVAKRLSMQIKVSLFEGVRPVFHCINLPHLVYSEGSVGLEELQPQSDWFEGVRGCDGRLQLASGQVLHSCSHEHAGDGPREEGCDQRSGQADCDCHLY